MYFISLVLENLALSSDDNEDLIYCLKVTSQWLCHVRYRTLSIDLFHQDLAFLASLSMVQIYAWLYSTGFAGMAICPQHVQEQKRSLGFICKICSWQKPTGTSKQSWEVPWNFATIGWVSWILSWSRSMGCKLHFLWLRPSFFLIHYLYISLEPL